MQVLKQHSRQRSHLTEVQSVDLGLHMFWQISSECVGVHFILSLLSVQPLYDHKYIITSAQLGALKEIFLFNKTIISKFIIPYKNIRVQGLHNH